MRLGRFYVSPLCAPTRSSLLTGRYHLRTGVWGVTGGRETMRADEMTIAEALKGAGYRTGLVGKWHLGEHYPCVPTVRGSTSSWASGLGHWNRYIDPPLERNGKPIETKGYISDVFTDEAIAFIDRRQSDPFFLYLAYNAPHSPYIVPDQYYDRFEGKGLTVPVASTYAMWKTSTGISVVFWRIWIKRVWRTTPSSCFFATTALPAGHASTPDCAPRKEPCMKAACDRLYGFVGHDA